MDKKIALVTGASRGIGRAISLKLIEKGYHVIGLARRFDSDLKQLESFEAIEVDLSRLDLLPDILTELNRRYPRLNVLVSNVGRGKFGTLEQFSFEQMNHLMHLNFLSHVYLVKAFLPNLKQQQSGTIIFIGSEAALSGKRQGSLYCASKFALRGFAQALREECATRHVRVCLINPGMVKTEFFDTLSFRPGDRPDEHLLPEDLADAVSFVLHTRSGAVIDELNVSPQKKNICFVKDKKDNLL